MRDEVVCQNEQEKKLHVIIDTKQREGTSTDESSPHDCVYIWH